MNSPLLPEDNGDTVEHESSDPIIVDQHSILCHNSYDKPNKPIGVSMAGTFLKFNSLSAKRTCHKALVLCITFLAYTCFHIGRRPLSIVKNVLNRNCSNVDHVTLFDNSNDVSYFKYHTEDMNNSTWCDWAPFNDDATANQKLAYLDSAFLFSYAIAMFFSGFLADRCNLRYYLSGGMIISGFLLYAFGLSYYMNIHSMSYFVIIQALSGIAQTTGWPSVVSCIGNWFDQSSRGSIFGVWNSNTNLGNMLGATIAGYFVEGSWGLSFIVPGFIMLITGVLTFLFLVPRPEDAGLLSTRSTADLKTCDSIPGRQRDSPGTMSSVVGAHSSRRAANRRKLIKGQTGQDSSTSIAEQDSPRNEGEQSPLISTSVECHQTESETSSNATSFSSCLKIPGVIEYSLSLGFAKLVSYTFLYWLPRYITQSTSNNSQKSAYLSVPFDLGGIIGAIIAGYLSDKYRKNALVCTSMLILAIPAMFVYQQFAATSNLHNICLQLLTGLFVTGPYSLITTAVSADLGGKIKDGKAMATVTAIIDGTGSIGAAAGPLFAGYLADSGWTAVFLMLMFSDLVSSLCLIRLTLKELGYR